ncbi:MAG: hypothetical protein O7E53_01690 [Alphaproteobacteria bacterium]|nr:hypothetical protein [Alphaproteobacteria bacterium]MCZ6885057.1 hypothetical protein [Alphaproteobacteria bacterium]
MLALALGILGLTACVPHSRSPLSSPEKAVIDQRLVGAWSGLIGKNRAFAHFIDRGESHMEIVFISFAKEERDEWLVFSMFTSVIGNDRYMNVKLSVERREIFAEKDRAYIPCRYSIGKDGKLRIWTMSPTTVAADIKAGLITGTKKGTGFTSDLILTADTARLRKYVVGTGPARVFGELLVTLGRIQ